ASAADAAMVARKPRLLDPRRRAGLVERLDIAPQRRRERSALFVEGDGVAGELDRARKRGVVELIALVQAERDRQNARNAKRADCVPDAQITNPQVDRRGG